MSDTTYTFFREETGTYETVERELWGWEAVYEDGTVLKQFADDGTFHQFKEIDQSKLTVFRMVNQDTGAVVTLLFEPGASLFHFYRNAILNQGTEGEIRIRAYCFGFKKEGRCNGVVITPQGEVIATSDIDSIKFM